MYHYFVISWHIDPKEKDVTCIRAYGINEKNENVCLRIDDFTPYIYMELPDNVEWNETRAQMVGAKIDELLGPCKPLRKALVYKKKLYYFYKDKQTQDRKFFPYLFMSFSNQADIQSFIYKTKKGIAVPQIRFIKPRIHEQDASPILQLTTTQDIPSAGWISFKGTEVVSPDEKETHCTHEYKVRW